MKYLRLICGLCLLMLLTSCDLFHGPRLRDTGSSYLMAPDGHSIVVPSGLSASKVGDAYQIPPAARTGPVPVSQIPPVNGIDTINNGNVVPPVKKRARGWW